MNETDTNLIDPTPRAPGARFELRSYVTGTHVDERGTKQATCTFPSGRTALVPFDRVMRNDWPDHLRFEVDP